MILHGTCSDPQMTKITFSLYFPDIGVNIFAEPRNKL